MSTSNSGLGGTNGAILAGAAMLLAIGLGAYLIFGRADNSGVDVSAPADVTTPTTDASVTEEPAPSPEDTAEAPSSNAPNFDEVRRETDGTTVIAGRASPMSDVAIMVDGAQVATAKADASGGFAAIAMLPPADDAQIVSLSSTIGETVTSSLDEVILTPANRPARADAASATVPDRTGTAEVSGDPSVGEVSASGQPPQDGLLANAPAAGAVPVSPLASATGDVGTPENVAQAPDVTQPDAAESPRMALLRSDIDGVSLLNPQVTSEVALDTIGYSDIGEVQLTGRAQPDTSQVRVYLDNRSVISLPVGADGRWRGDLPDVDEGVYTLRVDEVGADGAVSSRVETPFKRESAQTLAQASANTDGPVKSITVQTGATLWAIARDRYGDGTLYVRVFEANNDSIRDPDLIYPGQVFDLPN